MRRPVQLDTNRDMVIQDGAEPSEAEVFRAHAPPQGACENLVRAPTVGQCGDNLADTVFEGLHEQNRLNVTDEPRRFIEVVTTTRR